MCDLLGKFCSVEAVLYYVECMLFTLYCLFANPKTVERFNEWAIQSTELSHIYK